MKITISYSTPIRNGKVHDYCQAVRMAKNSEAMTKLERHELESVEKARKLLLAKFFDSSANDKLRKKEAVRQLLGTIIAVREAGMSFEEIATTFSEAGLVLNANTLRLYFYQLKAQAEIAAHEKAHAEQIARTRAQLESEDLQRFSTDALAAATEMARQTRINTRPSIPPAQAPAPSAATPQKAKKQQRARPPEGAAPPPPTHALEAAISRAVEGFPEPPPEPDAAHVVGEKRAEPTASGQGLGPTIEEAERAGANFRGVRPDLRENVVVHQGRIYYESGEPFDGVLTKAQAHFLRQIGKLIAPTQMTSSKDFVAMPAKL